MKKSDITEETLIGILLDPVKREELRRVMEAETGSALPITNHYEVIASQCKATPEEFRRVFGLMDVTSGAWDLLLEDLIFHPEIPEDILLDLLEHETFITALGHRAGPQNLLEVIAEKYQYREAIVTLMLSYYGLESADDDAFLEFVDKYHDEDMLQWNIKRLPDHKRQLAEEVLKKWSSK